ncbi:unnamed protein product, partial [Amoebophrya sp. A25]|eukprot:GSA25T00025215001.1
MYLSLVVRTRRQLKISSMSACCLPCRSVLFRQWEMPASHLNIISICHAYGVLLWFLLIGVVTFQ